MKRSRFVSVVAASIFMIALSGCGSSSTSTPSPAATADGEVYEVLSPEEAKSEADRTITEANADEEFDALSAEIEAELGDGG